MEDHRREFTIKQRSPTLPIGKTCHFFIVAAEEDRERVFEIVSHLENSFNLKCLYEARDCKPGVDRFEFMRIGMMHSVKVVLFLSPWFIADEMCRLPQKVALAASVDTRIPCIVPVLLDEVEDGEASLVSSYTLIDARRLEVDEVSEKLEASVESSDLYRTMFPNECTNVFARFENGYSVDIPVERDKLSCNRPAKYHFHVNRQFLNLLKDSQMKISNDLLQDIVKFVNNEDIMKSYDFLKKRNITCWGLLLMTPFSLLLIVLIFLILAVAMCTQDRPDEDFLGLSSIIMILGEFIGFNYPFILIALILAVPKLCHREKRDIDLQTKISSRFFSKCIENDVLVVFSGRKNRQPNLQVVRYNFGKCREYLDNVIRANDHLMTEQEVSTKDYIDNLIEQYAKEMAVVMVKGYDELSDASSNRHNVRKGKKCICQQIEYDLQTKMHQREVENRSLHP